VRFSYKIKIYTSIKPFLSPIYIKSNMEMLKPQEKAKSTYKSSKEQYTRDDIKNWISFGINNGFVNKFKKDEIAKWTDLMLKHGVIKMEGIKRDL
jgi:hypothetical protein